MTKEEIIFMRDYDIKEMSYYCANDDCFEAKFKTNQGEEFLFTASRAKVMEHVERFSAHPEKYLDNKGLIVAHFHRMARAWYRATHLSKDMVEATQFPRFEEVKS